MRIFRLFFVFCLLVLVSCNMSSNPCSNIKEDAIKSALKIDFDKLVEKNDIKGTNLCQIVIQKAGHINVFYAFPDGKTFLFGDVYQNGEFLNKATLARLQQSIFQNFSAEIEKVVAFSYKPEGANKYVYLITDPDCPFCERSKQAVKEWADSRKVEVKVIFFPLEQLHPQAKDKSIKAVCSGMDYQGYLNSDWKGQLCDEGKKKIEASIALMSQIQINGTPSFISYNGKRAVGFSPEGLDSIIK
ncbi:thioredoxin fold domain-containing protein [Thermodesulfovibrio hydrogeniphilus]